MRKDCTGDTRELPGNGYVSVVFVIMADADPDVLYRVAGLLRLGNVAPTRTVLRTCAAGVVDIRVELRAFPAVAIEVVRRKLYQLSTVRRAEAHVLRQDLTDRVGDRPCSP